MKFRKKKSFHVPRDKDDPTPKIAKRSFSAFKAFLFASISGVFFAIIALLVKHINNLPTEQLAFYRFVGIFFLSLPEAIKLKSNIFGSKEHRFKIFIRSIFSATHILLSYHTFRVLPLGEASVIILSYPALVAIFSKLFLKEPFGVIQGLILILTIVGISFIAKVPAILEGKKEYSTETTYGIIEGVVAVVLNASELIIVFKMRDVHHVVMMFNLGWIALIETAAVMAFNENIKWHDCGIQGVLIILLAVFNYGSQLLMIQAFQVEHAAPMTLIRASVIIILSFLFQVFIFKDTLDDYSIIGVTVLGVSFILSGMAKYY